MPWPPTGVPSGKGKDRLGSQGREEGRGREVADLELPVIVFPPRSVVVSGVAGDPDSCFLQLLHKLCCFVCHGLYITSVMTMMMIRVPL